MVVIYLKIEQVRNGVGNEVRHHMFDCEVVQTERLVSVAADVLDHSFL